MTGLYLECTVLCFLILVLLLWRTHAGTERRTERTLFSYALVCGMLLLLLDFFWKLCDRQILPSPPWVSAVLNALYYTMTGLMGFCWLRYEEQIRGAGIRRRRAQLLAAIPAILLGVLSFVSLGTGWMFSVDAAGVFHRGPLYFLQLVLSCGYIAWGSLAALLGGLREKDYGRRRKLLALSVFSLPAAIGGLLQAAFADVPGLCMGITLGTLSVFFSLQNQRISLDPLTRLNNRNRLMEHLSARVGAPRGQSRLYLLLMDVDFFKRINDTYGHLEGDAALRQVSELLRCACSGRKCFLARYGGDEFVLTCETEDPEDLPTLCNDLRAAMARYNRTSGRSYELTLSIGAAELAGDVTTPQQLIAAADRELYKAKAARVGR